MRLFMATDIPLMPPQNVRIPNLPLGQITDDKGFATETEQTWRQTLISSLQHNFGNEGCVVPTQTQANITMIQNNNYIDQATRQTVYTCQYGTMLYNSTANSIMIAVNNGSGQPVFRTVTLT